MTLALFRLQSLFPYTFLHYAFTVFTFKIFPGRPIEWMNAQIGCLSEENFMIV